VDPQAQAPHHLRRARIRTAAKKAIVGPTLTLPPQILSQIEDVPSLHALLCDIYYWQSYARNAYDAMDQVRRHFNKTMGQSTCVPPVVGAPDSGPLGACVVQPFGMLLYKEQCSDMYRELWRRYLNPGPNSLKLPPLCYEEIFFAPRPPFQQVRSVGEA